MVRLMEFSSFYNAKRLAMEERLPKTVSFLREPKDLKLQIDLDRHLSHSLQQP
jgi:hypothetical protein